MPDYTYFFVYKKYQSDVSASFWIWYLGDIKNTNLTHLMEPYRLYQDEEELIEEISEKFDVEKERIQILTT